jgi:capsular exopolysaccharide synthesis family protein
LVAQRQAAKQAAEEAVVAYERNVSVGTLENEKKVVSSAIIDGERELEQLRAKIDAASAKLAAIKRAKDGADAFNVGVSEVIDNPFIRQLKVEYVEVQGELARLSVDYLDKHPAVKALEARLSTLQKMAEKEVKSIVEAARKELDQLMVSKNKLEERIADFRQRDAARSNTEVEYDRLVATRDQAKEAYAKVQKRLIETQMSGQIRVNNVHILDAARTPVVPVKPNLRVNMALAILLGIFGGVAVAFGVEFLDNTVKSREDVEELFAEPFLGTVPSLRPERRGRRGEEPYDGKRELFVYYRPRSVVAEFTRAIRTNLMFMSPEKPLRVLMVTSPSPQEGKTTVAVNLAINMAANGGRTIIVDTDLRRPRVHGAFGIKALTGVSNYLISDAPVTQFTRSTEVENLDILPCGPCPPNPAELLHASRFRALIDELLQHYETVIFDSPPVNVVTDAQIIGNIVDGVVLVAKCGKTRRDALRHAQRQLSSVNARILGCVLNDVDIESRGYGGYYAMGRYAYGYTEARDDAERPA